MSDQGAIRVCVGCGASNAAEAQFCGICGCELLEEPDSEADAVFQSSSSAPSWQDPLWPAAPGDAEPGNEGSSDLGEMAAAAQAPREGVMQKRCDWCSSLNPWVAAVCETCGARFPVPEQDEAFRRAAEERLRQEEASLDFWRQRRRRGWRRFLM